MEEGVALSRGLEVGDTGDRLSVAFNTFFAELKVQPPRPEVFPFDVAITTRSRTGDRQLALQLCLKAGQFLETAAGTSVLLGEDRLVLSSEQIGRWIRHN